MTKKATMAANITRTFTETTLLFTDSPHHFRPASLTLMGSHALYLFDIIRQFRFHGYGIDIFLTEAGRLHPAFPLVFAVGRMIMQFSP